MHLIKKIGLVSGICLCLGGLSSCGSTSSSSEETQQDSEIHSSSCLTHAVQKHDVESPHAVCVEDRVGGIM